MYAVPGTPTPPSLSAHPTGWQEDGGRMSPSLWTARRWSTPTRRSLHSRPTRKVSRFASHSGERCPRVVQPEGSAFARSPLGRRSPRFSPSWVEAPPQWPGLRHQRFFLALTPALGSVRGPTGCDGCDDPYRFQQPSSHTVLPSIPSRLGIQLGRCNFPRLGLFRNPRVLNAHSCGRANNSPIPF